MNHILHITTLAAWEEARTIGLYEPTTLRREGFIHFSTAEQVVRVANNLYRAVTGLVLLVVDVDRLTAELRWEDPSYPASVDVPPVVDELFPHLYGPLNVDAVVKVMDFPPGDDGWFTLHAIELE